MSAMPMTEVEAKALVDLLARAYPTYPATSETRDLYVAALQNDRHDARLAAAAVHSWVVNEPRMPKVSELLEAIEVERSIQRVQDSDRRAAGVLPAGEPTRSRPPSAVLLRVQLLRQVRDELKPEKHDHHRGSENCPACRLRDDYVTLFAARFEQLVREHASELVDDRMPETFVCVQCLDTGWIDESLVDGESFVRPCPCRPETYDRWREGHFAPGHYCSECEALKRGRRAS